MFLIVVGARTAFISMEEPQNLCVYGSVDLPDAEVSVIAEFEKRVVSVNECEMMVGNSIDILVFSPKDVEKIANFNLPFVRSKVSK